MEHNTESFEHNKIVNPLGRACECTSANLLRLAKIASTLLPGDQLAQDFLPHANVSREDIDHALRQAGLTAELDSELIRFGFQGIAPTAPDGSGFQIVISRENVGQ